MTGILCLNGGANESDKNECERGKKVPSNLIIQSMITVLADDSYDKSAAEEIVI